MKTDAKSIPVKLSGECGVRYGNEPLTFGVPFAEGDFPVGARLRAVTADGREIPLQTSVMTTWKKDLRDVKWLLADVQADPVLDSEKVFLEFPAKGECLTPEQAITTSEANGLLTVDTGALRLKLRTNYERWRHHENDSPFAGCQIKTAEGWRDVLHGPGLLLYMKDQHGNLYTSLGICPAPKVVIEEQGALRVCVLITGHLTSAQGVRFCPYKLRIHLYAGKADLRIFHTFIFDQDPTRIELAAIGLKVLAKTGDGAVAAVGGEGAAAHGNRKFKALSIVQTDDLNYTAQLDGQTFYKGGKAAGWAALGGADASVVASIRDFWQEYPKGFQIERNVLDVRVWPEDAPKPLSFITPFDEPPINFNGTRDEDEIKRLLAEHPTAPLALNSFGISGSDDVRWVEDVVARLAPGRAMSYNDFMGVFTGIGAAKTTEIVLRFAAGPVASAEAAAFGAAVREPLMGIVDPGYLCGTDVFGRFLAAGHPLFTELDRGLNEYFDRMMIEPLVRCRWYGMMLHGHTPNLHTGGMVAPGVVYNLFKDTEPEKALCHIGPYGNEAMDSVQWSWSQFLHSGERRHLRWAQLASRATAETSFVHAFPGHEENVGCIHYHGPHVWANALNRSHSETGTFATDYHITGNRRMREIALEAADGLADNKLEPCGIITCFSPISREFVGPLAILMEAYQLTWHEKYGTPAERSLNWLLRTVRTPGFLPASVYTRGPRGAEAVVEGGEALSTANNPYHALGPALRLFPSQPLRDFVLAQAKYGAGAVEVYDLTKDREIAASMAGVAECGKDFAPGQTSGFWALPSCDHLPRVMKIVAMAAEADPDGFWEYVRKWRAKQKANPKPAPAMPPEQKGQSSLGVLSTEPFA